MGIRKLNMKIRVYYEDTDAGGIVYHSNYLNFCERARSELLFENGISPLQENQGFVVKHIDASFVKPAKLGDILEVKTILKELKKVSMTLKQTVYNKNNEILFDMNITLVYINNTKMSKIPPYMIEVFTKIIYSPHA